MNTDKKTIILTVGELSTIVRALKTMALTDMHVSMFSRDEDINKIVNKLEDVLWEGEE